MKEDLRTMQELFNKYYTKGLVGLSDTYIQLESETFKELCKGTRVYSEDRTDRIELYATIDVGGKDLRIMTLL